MSHLLGIQYFYLLNHPMDLNTNVDPKTETFIIKNQTKVFQQQVFSTLPTKYTFN